mmetsp:Transcript_148871/g.387114  ORF Transcript_148871/g.387114 Transcript_148871/m.387114 type:complete len:249 (-) Transcript_148871:146-892(-)
MASMLRRHSNRRRGLGGRALAVALTVAALILAGSAAASAFVSGSLLVGRRGGGAGVARHAEGAGAPSPSPSVALVKVTEESKVTTASLLGGLAGLLVGGVWVGAGLFAAGSYLARKEDSDLSKALKGVASGGLEVLNFGAYLNDKYAVTDKLGSAISEAVDSATEASGSSKDSADSASGFFKGLADAVRAADEDIDFKGTFGTLTTSASDLANQAVEKAVQVNEQYKITDQIKEKIDEATEGAKSTSA